MQAYLATSTCEPFLIVDATYSASRGRKTQTRCHSVFDAHSSFAFFHERCRATERTVNFEPLLREAVAQEDEWQKKAGLPHSTRAGTRNRATSTRGEKNRCEYTPEYSVWKNSAGASDALVGSGWRQSAAYRDREPTVARTSSTDSGTARQPGAKRICSARSSPHQSVESQKRRTASRVARPDGRLRSANSPSACFFFPLLYVHALYKKPKAE